ncbi:zinc finger protein [Loa loa]|uniref:Zinc finger protein n=2 Tax=Loa loa TaxID=7209 RepID=A0A1S0ULA9_LOALO|nr:zinc finger protein [Loa loa]EJD76138.1 zinc finger protein [Loa loa]
MDSRLDTVNGETENENENDSSSVQKRKVTSCNTDRLTDSMYGRTPEVNELDRKRQRLEVDRNKQLVTKQEQQLQKKKNVMNVRSSINFTTLVGYKRLQYAGPHESRTIISRLYNFEKLADISGGFRLYLRLMTDAILNEICNKIDDLSDRFNKSKDMDLCISQVLRYTWSQLSDKERLTYETVARRKVQEKYKTELDKMRSDRDSRSEKSISATKLQWIRSLPAMPLTEFKFMSAWAKKQRENEHYRVHCKRLRCPFCKNMILRDDTLQMHILYGHHNMYVYACHFCFEGFTSLEQLKQHCCEEFTQFMLRLVIKETKLEMMFAMHTLICAECNLQVPLSSLSNSSSDKKCIKLQRLLNYHSTDKLVSCIILFAVRPSEVEYVTMRGCAMKCGIPLRCKFCSHKFVSAADIEKHQLSEHSGEVIKLKCPVCPRFYITDCFFRDHLLSHLGEVHSMTGLLDKATFRPSAFSHDTACKMGPSLQKIIGSDIAEISRIEKPDDLSDDEDESYEKSVLDRKSKLIVEKKVSKKVSKGTDQNLCYYCRHAKQLMTKPLQSSLCRCIKSRRESKSFATKNSFVKSLVEKFTREGRLYIDKKDSILDTTIGAVIDDSVFICIKCKGLHLGDQNTLKHLRICMQKDVESPDPEKHFDLMDNKIVIRLTQSCCSPNGRISCPECEVTSCSIASLRRHLALDHGIFAYYNIPESHRAVGIMEYVSSKSTKDAKLDIAARINLELNLTPTGDFKQRDDRCSQSSSLISRNNTKLATSSIHATENFQAAPMSAETRSTLMQAFMEPTQSSTVMGKFICILCFTPSASSQQLANHFVRSHLHLCSECGSGFVEKQCLLSHLASCQKWPRKCSDGEFFPRCPICSFLFLTPERYFYHLLHCHNTSLYISEKQQVNPMFIWKKLSLIDASKLRRTLMDKLIIKNHDDFIAEDMSNSSILPVRNTRYAESVVADKFMCALCELDFPNRIECDIHLQKHPEQWSCCPVCMYFRDHYPIRTIGELFEHLLFKHTVKSLQPKGVKIVCSLCQSLSSCESTVPLSVKLCEEQMIRHILYTCSGTQVCFLCNDGVVYSPEKLKKHRVSEHRIVFERFGCSECSRKFHTCSAFKKHSCNVLLKCSCGVSALFTEEEFEKHFEKHLNSMKDFCLLCNKYLFSQDQLLSHVMLHRIVVNGKRQLVQLNMPGNVLSFPGPNITTDSNMKINVPSKKHNATTFLFGKVKISNGDDGIQFLGSGSLTNDANGSENEGRRKHAGDNDVVFVAETLPANFMTNVRSETGAVTEAVSSFYTYPVEATASIPDIRFPVDEIMSGESGPSATIFGANTTDVASPIIDGQNSTTRNGFPTKSMKKELASAKASYTPADVSDDDDIVFIDELENESPSTDEVLKEGKKVVDKIGDSDLEIVEGAERHSGPYKREAKFHCSQCTEKFLTRASLLIHKQTHKYDAGQTIEAVYGIPVETILYICRLCCLAYESQVVYQMHMRTHGALQNCERCSVVAFNEEQMRNHQDQHVPSTGRQQVVYVCSKCVATYSTDARLYHHMLSAHAQAILYFCKNCGLANTNGCVVYEHIVRGECAWRNLSSVSEFVIMGFTAACIFHYQPANPVQYENRVRNNELLVVIPSECIHRSFLSLPNDVISITCPTCNSLMSFLRLQAENPRFTGSLPRTLNHAVDDNDAMMLTMLSIWRMENIDQHAIISNTRNQQTATSVGLPSKSCTLSRVAVPSGVPLPTSLSGVCISQNHARAVGGNTSITQPSSQISWVPARQALTAVSTSASPSSSLQIVGTNSHPGIAASPTQPVALSVSTQTGAESPSPPSNTPPYLQPYRGALEAVGLTVGTQMVTRDYIVKNAEGEYFCARSGCANVRIEKITSGRVHNLRHNPQNIFFCLECGSAFPFENLTVKHMIEFHHQKQTPSLSLRCPLCPKTPPFTRVELFRKHMAESAAHSTAAYSFNFKQRCKLRFHSIEARLRHDHEHRATRNAACCFVCGTSRNWWFSPARADFPYIDHSYIHAFSLWGVCRECGLSYPNELKNQQYFHHFKEQHMTKASDIWHCKICNIEIDNCNVHVHALQRHFVIGVKIDRRKPYVVETSEAVMRAFLGYPVPDNARV